MKRIEHREKEYIFPFVEYSPSIKMDKKLPLIIQLHGAGERGKGETDLDKVDIHGFSKKIKYLEYDCIFIMPQCPSNSFWVAKTESVLEFINQIKKNYCIDEDRIYLTGLSMGGYGTWFISMAKPDLFAAIAPVCGGGMAWNAHSLKMPVWAFHGTDDPTVNVFHSDEMIKALNNKNPNVKYTRLDGVAHNAWDYAYTEELIEWLLSKKKHLLC